MTLRRPFSWGLLLTAVLSLPALAQNSSIPWTTNLEAAKAEARQTGRLVLIHYWTEDCPPCVALENNVFTQPEVAAALTSQFVPVKLNANDNPATAASMGVNRVPTDIVITPDGEMITKMISPATPMAYIGELSRVVAKQVGRSGQSFANAAAVAPAPSQLNAAYAGLPLSPSAMPSTNIDNSQPLAATSRYQPVLQGLQPGPAFGPPAGPATTQPFATGYNGIPAVAPAGPAMAGGLSSQAPQRTDLYSPPQLATVNNQFVPQQVAPAQTQPAPHSIDASTNRFAMAPTVPQTYLNAAAGVPAIPVSAQTTTAAPAQQSIANQFAFGSPAATPQGPQAPPQPSMPTGVASGAAPDTRQLPAGAMPLGFDGFCPVSMRNSNLTKWVPGNPQFGVQHRGRTYWFAGQQEKAQFWANPDTYAPALSGLDPVMFLDHRQQVPGSREHSVDYDSTFYMFASEASLQQFQTNPKKYVTGVREAMGLQKRTLR